MQRSFYFPPEDYNRLLAIAAYHRCSISKAAVIAVNGEFDRIANIPTEPVKLVYVKPTQHDATGLIYTPALHSAIPLDLETLRDDVHQEEQAQAARDAAKEQE